MVFRRTHVDDPFAADGNVAFEQFPGIDVEYGPALEKKVGPFFVRPCVL